MYDGPKLSPLTQQWADRVEDSIENRVIHNQGVSHLRRRSTTEGIVIHGVGGGVIEPTPEGVEHFFLKDPEGIATVTMSGAYSQKKSVFTGWWVLPDRQKRVDGVPKAQYRIEARTKIPAANVSRAFVPYHFAISGARIIQWLPWRIKGAHTVGWNNRSVSIALIRNLRKGKDLTEYESIALANLITWCCMQHRGKLHIMTHDDARASRGLGPKPCPNVDVGRVVSWAQTRANIMINRRRRPGRIT